MFLMWCFGGLGVETEMVHPSAGIRWPRIWAAVLAVGGGALTPTGPLKATMFHFINLGSHLLQTALVILI